MSCHYTYAGRAGLQCLLDNAMVTANLSVTVSQAVDTQASRSQKCLLAKAQLLVDAKTHSVEDEELAHC